MPITPTYPGVYIEELPSGVRTITGVATSITAFVGRALQGPVDEAVRIQSFGDFERTFGGLWIESPLSYAVHQYFLNGGRDALVIRVHNGAAAATLTLPAGAESFTLEAQSPGAWGNDLQATVDHETKDATEASPDPDLFNLTIKVVDPDTGEATATETFLNLSMADADARFVTKVLELTSDLVRVKAGAAFPASRPDETAAVAANGDGTDGNAVTDAQVLGTSAAKTGLYALENADLFNLLCLPPLTRDTDVAPATFVEALAYCKTRRAMLIVDPPSTWTKHTDAVSGVDGLGLRDENAALFFPRVKLADSLRENRLETFAPSGVMAGVFARTDAQRGVWKGPAGLEATLTGVRELSVKLTDGECGQLNPLGVNCLRTFPVVGNVAWGARTLRGADRLASEWKYVPVRRVALFIEESLYRGTQWVVFEPNDERLWAQIRLNVGAFMHDLFRQGAFQGQSAREAYFVKCDGETTTQTDIDRGIVNILVGFAPLKPAEFVVVKIQQMAGEIET